MNKIIFENGKTKVNAETFTQFQENIEETINNAIKLILPIGAIYITQTDTNPNAILGFGTWERLKGKVLVGLDEDDTDFNEIGKTGGTKTQEHDLNTNSAVAAIQMNTNGTIDYGETPTAENIPKTYTVTTGGSGANATKSNKYGAKLYGKTSSESNLQPYEVIGYMWKRTA